MPRAIFWLCLLCALVVVPLIAWRGVSRLKVLQQHGTVVQADIFNVRYVKSGAMMTVGFSNNGRWTEAERGVSVQFGSRYESEKHVPVTLMPSDPKEWEIGTVDTATIGSYEAAWASGDFFFLLISLLCVSAFEAGRIIEQKILRDGSAVMGSILSSERVGKTKTNIRYQFETFVGTYDQKGEVMADVADEFPPGKEVVVFYVGEDKPRSRALGFFQYVELEP